MKPISQILSACALLGAAVTCYGAETQKIYLQNKTTGSIWGGVYATTAVGKVLDLLNPLVRNMSEEIEQGRCRVITITKPKDKKTKQFHRLIFAKNSTDPKAPKAVDAINNKVFSDNGTHVSSTIIKQFTGEEPLYYAVYDDKSLITRAPKLKFKQRGPFECQTSATGILTDLIQSVPDQGQH